MVLGVNIGKQLGLKQFRQDGCMSYIVFDSERREAAILDPRLDLMPDYRDFIASHGLKLKIALDSHVHADHFSATHELQAEYRCEIGMSARTQSARPTRKLADGDKIALGSLTLEVFEIPGHTPDSLCFHIAGVLFTGDTLMIGSTGRTDFPGADPSQLWDSLMRILKAFPGETVVFPGHEYSNLLFTKLSVEKDKNPHLKFASKELFVAFKSSEAIPSMDDEVRKRVEFNLSSKPEAALPGHLGTVASCGSPREDIPRGAAISVEKYSMKLDEKSPDTAFIDVREPDEFEAGHIPGMQNIPMSEVALNLDNLSKKRRIYVSCLSGRRSSYVANTLTYVGFPDVVNVSGGFKAWTNAGFSVEK